MSAGSYPAISGSRVPAPVAALIGRVRSRAATSVVWRSMLLGTLGLTVTVAGVCSGCPYRRSGRGHGEHDERQPIAG